MKKRDASLDLLREISMLLVIIIHVSAQGFYVFNSYWSIGVLYNCFSRVAVPIFFMVSGACLINKMESTKQWLLRIWNKALFPYLIWSMIYVVYISISTKQLVGFSNILINAPYYHLGFMLQYLSFLLILPVIRGFYNNAEISNQTKKIIIFLILLSSGLLNVIQPFIKFNLIGGGLVLSPFSYYVGMGLLGVYLYENKKVKKKVILLFEYSLFSLVTLGLVLFQSFTSRVPNESFFQYSSPFIILSSICLFELIVSFDLPKKIENKVILFSSFTFDIYLLHPMILDIFNKLGVSWNVINPIIWIPIYSLLVLFVCICAIKCYRIVICKIFELSK